MKSLRRKLKWKKKPLFLKTSYWLNRLVENLSDRTVMQGPFAGLKYIAGIPGDCYTPQLLGTYELELHEAVAELVRYEPDLVINVGAGEGFYAIGFARSLRARMVAFEAQEQMRARLAAMAEANGVADRILIRGTCKPPDLESSLASAAKPLVVMDIDGGEGPVLDLEHAPSLRNVAILVETHDMFVPGITRELTRRFEGTHQIREISTRGRWLSDLPMKAKPIVKPLLRRAMREHRGGRQAWLVMFPKAEIKKAPAPRAEASSSILPRESGFIAEPITLSESGS